MDKRPLTRRAFVIGAAAVAVGAAAGVGASPLRANIDVLRPPGALPEAEFMARCIRCDRCISICPTDILYPLGLESGGVAVRTPSIDYANGCCTFCDECRKVCPTAAIGTVDPFKPSQGRIGLAKVHSDRCLAFSQTGSCGVCVDACAYGALSFDAERRPVVDESLCNGCGECVHVCPANVLTSFSGGHERGIEVVTMAQSNAMGGQ